MIKLNALYFDDLDPKWHKEQSMVESHMLLLVTRGELTYWLNHEEISLEKGDLLYIPPGTLRSAVGNPERLHQKYVAIFDIAGSPAELDVLRNGRYIKTKTLSFDYQKQRFSLLAQQWLGKLPYFEEICGGILTEMLGIASRETDTGKFSFKKTALVREMQQYILERYREPIHMEELARLLDRTPNYLSGVFKEVTGSTPIDYLHLVRISSARDLLLYTGMSIAEVAEYLGFCDQSYFNRIYKKMTGLPPSSLLRERNRPVKTT